MHPGGLLRAEKEAVLAAAGVVLPHATEAYVDERCDAGQRLE
jgi:hypothetical protein